MVPFFLLNFCDKIDKTLCVWCFKVYFLINECTNYTLCCLLAPKRRMILLPAGPNQTAGDRIR